MSLGRCAANPASMGLDRLIAAGKIREMDRAPVTFIVRTIVHPPKWPYDLRGAP